jgi:hypothetical protein
MKHACFNLRPLRTTPQTNCHKRMQQKDPGGVTAISRWLSEATPPEAIDSSRIDPGGGRSTRESLCDPSGVGISYDRQPVVSLRSTTG